MPFISHEPNQRRTRVLGSYRNVIPFSYSRPKGGKTNTIPSSLLLAERRAWQRRESILRSLGQSPEKAEPESLAQAERGLARRNA